MSHTSVVKAIKIQSLDALRSAVAELAQSGLKLTLQENATPRAFYANQAGLGKADIVLRVEDAQYDVGFYKNPEGYYEARADFFGGSIARVLGAAPSPGSTMDQAALGKLFQMYGIHVATATARKQGHMVRRIQKANGMIALEVTGPNL